VNPEEQRRQLVEEAIDHLTGPEWQLDPAAAGHPPHFDPLNWRCGDFRHFPQRIQPGRLAHDGRDNRLRIPGTHPEHAGADLGQFSAGMTSRLAVAASLINEPDLLVWDEPTHGLDPEARRSMLELIKTFIRF